MPLYHYFMCNEFEDLTTLYNTLGTCSLNNHNTTLFDFSTLYFNKLYDTLDASYMTFYPKASQFKFTFTPPN